MRCVLAVAVGTALGLMATLSVASAPTPVLLDEVDIDTVSGAVECAGNCSSFNAEQPGAWGGEFGEGAVTAFPGDSDPAGYVTLDTGGAGKARHIEMRVLDGIADDSFDVYVKNPGGQWALAYSYTADPSTAEVWLVHHIYSFPAGKGQGARVDIKIVPTNLGWWGFDTWGQLGVDYVKLWDH